MNSIILVFEELIHIKDFSQLITYYDNLLNFYITNLIALVSEWFIYQIALYDININRTTELSH